MRCEIKRHMGRFPAMSAPPELSDDDLARIREPSALLDRAWALEPWGRYAERAAALDALECCSTPA